MRIRRRTVGDALSQRARNVELGNFTQALAAARSHTMSKVHEVGEGVGGSGIVQLWTSNDRLPFAHHVVSFIACGTVIGPLAQEHGELDPQLAVDLRDRARSFQATSLRGASGDEPAEHSGISGSESTWRASIRARLRSATRSSNYET